jgi:hypothetical protein
MTGKKKGIRIAESGINVKSFIKEKILERFIFALGGRI